MKQLLQLAWRNIGRKRRRSTIAIVSVAFAVIISVSLRSLMLGNYDKMIEAGVKNSGYVQVHAQGYWDDKSINDLISNDPITVDKIKSTPGVKSLMPRLQNFALATGAHTSKAVMVNGLSPEAEDAFTRLSDRLVAGHFITDTSHQVVIAEGLANYLKLGVNDTLVLVGQGYHANLAAGRYIIRGLVKLPNPQANLNNVFMPLPLAQQFASAPDLVSAYMIDIRDDQSASVIQESLVSQLGQHYEVMTWDEMLPEIRNSQRIDTTIFTMLASCLYLIIGMGLIGTILMMALERKKEFGILQAIGLQKAQIQMVIVMEAVILGLLGIITAFAIAIPFVLYMNANPIPLTGDSGKSFEAMGVEPVLQLGVKPHLFALMALIVFGIMLVSTLFPMWFIQRMKISEAIKSR